MSEAADGVDAHAAQLAAAFLRKMAGTAQLARCRTDLKTIYDESVEAWWPDDEGDGGALEAVTFSQVLYAMAHGELQGTTLSVRVENGSELVWRRSRHPRRRPQHRHRGVRRQ